MTTKVMRSPRRALILALILSWASAGARAADLGTVPDEVVLFKDVALGVVPGGPELADSTGFGLRHPGQSAIAEVDLGPRPLPADEKRLVLTITVAPVEGENEQGISRPLDPWTRLGSVTIESPSGGPPCELARFMTGYGSAGSFEADITALAPLFVGRQTFRVYMSTFGARETWRVSVTLQREADGAGARRPMWAKPLWANGHVWSGSSVVRSEVVVPATMETPRIRLISTGHATDGLGAHEFETAAHVLRVDGVEVLRFRPWSERGSLLRSGNRYSGRQVVEGREIWSSDLDRAGWHPGQIVDALVVPLPELTPGRHVIELEVLGIRTPGPKPAPAPGNADLPSASTPAKPGIGPHGYWVESALLLADTPWPEP